MMPMIYMASALAVEDAKNGEISVVQSFQISCWLTCKKLGNLTKKGITMTSTM